MLHSQKFAFWRKGDISYIR